MAYEISGTGTPSKTPYKWGLLKFGMKVTARLQPKVTAKPCSFSPIAGLTKIEVCDQITDPDTGRVWDYCKVGDKYGFILYTSIRDYLRTPGQSIEKVARWVIANDFSADETRRKALESLGYNYDEVQKVVTDLMPKPAPAKSNKFCVWAVNFMEDDERQYGDCTAVIQYNEDGTVKHCVLIDCAKYAAAYVVVRKLKAHGVKRIDAVCISHAHGDHYGGLSYIMKHIPVNHIYVPDVTELNRYQKSYGSAIKSQAKKAPSTYLKAGTGFSIGDIKCKCIFISDAITATEPTTIGQKTVDSASLDGVAWYTRPTETWETLYDGAGNLEAETPYPYFWISPLADVVIPQNSVWRITFDGTEYICTATQTLESFGYTIGNPLYSGGADDGSGVPLNLYRSPWGGMVRWSRRIRRQSHA